MVRRRISSGEWFITWMPPVLWSGAILLVAGDVGSSSQTRFLLSLLRDYLPWLATVPLPVLNRGLRTVGHVLAYAGLLAVWLRACWRQWPARDISGLGMALGLTLLVAVMDEGRQSWHLSRTGSVRDVLLDMIGALSAALIFLVVRLRKLSSL